MTNIMDLSYDELYELNKNSFERRGFSKKEVNFLMDLLEHLDPRPDVPNEETLKQQKIVKLEKNISNLLQLKEEFKDMYQIDEKLAECKKELQELVQ